MTLNEEQQLLHDTICKALDGLHGEAMQQAVCELGLAGIALPEQRGGIGGDAFLLGVALDAMGRGLHVTGLLEHWTACRVLATSSTQSEVLERAVGGLHPLTLAMGMGSADAAVPAVQGTLAGRWGLVPAIGVAQSILLAASCGGEDAIYLLPAQHPALDLQPLEAIDGTTVGDAVLAPVQADSLACILRGPEARAQIDWAKDAMVLGRAAEIVGLCHLMLADSIEYARTRQQFGQPIAGFQALRHRIVDMRIALDMAEALVEAGLHTLDDAAAETRTRLATCARQLTGRAVEIVGEGAVQVHGAMGITDELRIGAALKRAMALVRWNDLD
jgi:alkylation response protein AidB-like acyl-CoA dehydrogenase